jgi:hypothetical protein
MVAPTLGTNTSINIPENSFFLKAATCIPVLGNVFGVFQQYSLVQKLQHTVSNDTISITNRIFLINVKNDYRVADLIRTITILALIVAQFAVGLFTGMYVFFGILVSIGILLAGKNIYAIYANHQNIKQLQTVGFTPGTQIY